MGFGGGFGLGVFGRVVVSLKSDRYFFFVMVCLREFDFLDR